MKKTLKMAFLFLGILASSPTAWAQKQKITRADQLPRRTYSVSSESFISAMDNAVLMNNLAIELKENLLSDLERFEIEDPSTLKAYYSTLGTLERRDNNLDQLLAYTAKSKELSQKTSERLLSGLGAKAFVDAVKKVGQRKGTEFENAYKASLAASYEKLPYEKVSEELLASRNQLKYMTRDLILGGIKTQLEPIVKNMGNEWDESIIASLFTYEQLLNEGFALIPVQIAVIDAWEKSNNTIASREKKNIWKDREVDLNARASELNPVVIAVWDTGVDAKVFEDKHRFQDINGNTGIAFDKEGNQSSKVLLPERNLTYSVNELEKLIGGFFDLQYNISSPAADLAMKKIQSLSQDEVKAFQEDLTWYGTYSHGTHVAGIALDNNPAAQVLAARLEYNTASMPDVPTIEKAKRWANMFSETINYFKENNVRVVNMSWRYNSQSYEGALSANGVGGTIEERKALAKEIFDIEKNALYTAMKNAPEILFVCGSGNENNDADFAAYIPAGFNLPNLITIGAVDIEGKKASFTTEGKSVDFYANGHEIESFVPGGNRLKFSGTSMASPQVANLAGKLFAINPNLSVEEIISLIAKGSDISEEGIRRINAKKSVSLLSDDNAIKSK